jgi:hypothetical protein
MGGGLNAGGAAKPAIGGPKKDIYSGMDDFNDEDHNNNANDGGGYKPSVAAPRVPGGSRFLVNDNNNDDGGNDFLSRIGQNRN